MAVPASIPINGPSCVKRARERFLDVHGAWLFTLLPKSLRNEDAADFMLFKKHMDIFLVRIPDEPTMAGLYRAAATNSLLDQVTLVCNLDLV